MSLLGIKDAPPPDLRKGTASLDIDDAELDALLEGKPKKGKKSGIPAGVKKGKKTRKSESTPKTEKQESKAPDVQQQDEPRIVSTISPAAVEELLDLSALLGPPKPRFGRRASAGSRDEAQATAVNTVEDPFPIHSSTAATTNITTSVSSSIAISTSLSVSAPVCTAVSTSTAVSSANFTAPIQSTPAKQRALDEPIFSAVLLQLRYLYDNVCSQLFLSNQIRV